MTAAVRLTDWVERWISPDLLAAGYRRAGATFYRKDGENWGLIEFQRHTHSAAGVPTFTVNVGVASARLLESRGSDPRKRPRSWDLHASWRLGEEAAPNQERWWTLTSDPGEQTRVAEEVMGRLRKGAIPFIDQTISDRGLFLYWQRQNPLNPARAYFLAALGIGRDSHLARAEELPPTDGPEAEVPPVPLVTPPLYRQTRARLASLRRMLESSSALRRRRAVVEISGWRQSLEVMALLRRLLADDDPYVRAYAAVGLARHRDAGSLARLMELIPSAHGEEAMALIWAATQLALDGPEESRDRLRAILQGLRLPAQDAAVIGRLLATLEF